MLNLLENNKWTKLADCIFLLSDLFLIAAVNLFLISIIMAILSKPSEISVNDIIIYLIYSLICLCLSVLTIRFINWKCAREKSIVDK